MGTNKIFHVNSSPIGRRVSAYLILDKFGNIAGRIHVLKPQDGAHLLKVTLYDMVDKSQQVQSAISKGFGFDKLADCMSQLEFAGKTLSIDWESELSVEGYKVIQAI